MKTVRRQRFFFNLGALGAAGVLIIAAVAFGPGAVKGVGLGIGISSCSLSLLFVAWLVHQRPLAGHLEFQVLGRGWGLWSVLAGAMASVAIWQIVGVAVFTPHISRWLTLANGLVIAALACIGLIAHEMCTERVVHVVEVVERPASS